MEAPEVRYARNGDVNIAYGVVGDGPFDLVFIGGWVLSTLEYAWDGPAADTLSQLASFCRLIVFDKRGTGLSDRDYDIPDLETRMDDIRAVMDAAGSERAAVLGVSEGGPMTLLFAATYPDRIAAAILYGTGACSTYSDDYPWGATPEEWDSLLEPPDPPIGSEEWVQKRLRDLSPSIADDPAVQRWWRRWVLTSASPGAVRALTRTNRGVDVRHVLPAITVPTLVIHPRDDEAFYLDEGRYIADHVPGAELVVLPGEDHGWWVHSDGISREVKRFLGGLWGIGEWGPAVYDRVLATVMFTDIVGSTALLEELGDSAWKALLAEHHTLVRRELLRYSGREIDTAGDGFFASFDGPARAIRCACAITDSVRNLGIEVRAGLHTGECEVIDGKVGGIAVHIGARVAARAGPGDVLVSSTVHDLVTGSGIGFEDRGETELKGVSGNWRLYTVVNAVPVG